MISLANLIRCLGLYLVIHALATILPFAFYAKEYVSGVGYPASIYVLPTVLYFVGGVFMTFKGGTIAQFLNRGESEPDPVPVLEAGIYLIGIWWLFRGLSDLIYHFFAMHQEQSVGQIHFTESTVFPSFVATLFELAAAVILLLKGHRISEYLSSLPSGKG